MARCGIVGDMTEHNPTPVSQILVSAALALALGSLILAAVSWSGLTPDVPGWACLIPGVLAVIVGALAVATWPRGGAQ
jgi:hypothetical protein